MVLKLMVTLLMLFEILNIFSTFYHFNDKYIIYVHRTTDCVFNDYSYIMNAFYTYIFH